MNRFLAGPVGGPCLGGTRIPPAGHDCLYTLVRSLCEFRDARPSAEKVVQPPVSGTMTGPGCPIADRLPEHSGPAHSVDELP